MGPILMAELEGGWGWTWLPWLIFLLLAAVGLVLLIRMSGLRRNRQLQDAAFDQFEQTQRQFARSEEHMDRLEERMDRVVALLESIDRRLSER